MTLMDIIRVISVNNDCQVFKYENFGKNNMSSD